MNKPRDLTAHEKEERPRDQEQNDAAKTGRKPLASDGQHPRRKLPSGSSLVGNEG